MFTNRIPWVILLLVWMTGSVWWHVCKIKLLCLDAPPPSVAAPAATATVPDLLLADGNQFRFANLGNFSFAHSGAIANKQHIGSLLDSLTHYLKTTPGKTLLINGYFSPKEQNSSAFTNLGLARADGIKQSLKQLGLADSVVTTTGIATDSLMFSAKGDSIYGGISFNFITKDITPKETIPTTTTASEPPSTQPMSEVDLAEKEKFTSVFDPIDLYFPLSEAAYIKTEETSKFFKEAITYLSTHKNKKLVLTGYTDTTGPDAVNLQLSRDRANSVKLRLRQSGVNKNQIRVEAKGEADPKADNSTLPGRKANRRVSVVVQ